MQMVLHFIRVEAKFFSVAYNVEFSCHYPNRSYLPLWAHFLLLFPPYFLLPNQPPLFFFFFFELNRYVSASVPFNLLFLWIGWGWNNLLPDKLLIHSSQSFAQLPGLTTLEVWPPPPTPNILYPNLFFLCNKFSDILFNWVIYYTYSLLYIFPTRM